jgi:hypothetical protein
MFFQTVTCVTIVTFSSANFVKSDDSDDSDASNKTLFLPAKINNSAVIALVGCKT